MARRTWEQAFNEELPKLKETLIEATDDIRHKVIEQAWSGQEQTGSIMDGHRQGKDVGLEELGTLEPMDTPGMPDEVPQQDGNIWGTDLEQPDDDITRCTDDDLER